MCGILGEYVYKKDDLSSAEDFSKLLELSSNRGPDSTKVISDQYFHFGFNRLAIQDLSDEGNQPMLSDSGKYLIVFNGEIYNFKELIEKHDLTGLHSTSDTEVLVKLLDKIGVEDTLHSIIGMFSIGILDTENQKLTLIRDIAGIKPLYYGLTTKGAYSPLNSIKFLITHGS